MFRRLVPQGHAEMGLVELVTLTAAEHHPGMESRGIRLAAEFEAPAQSKGRPQLPSALSPGQKTIVSISLILALQKCYPSPFYCFDEIDADLDNAYLKAIAALLKDIARDSQVFVTTFRPETLDIKKSHVYKVEMLGRESVVKLTDHTEALKLIGR